jgi:hypothetical protein
MTDAAANADDLSRIEAKIIALAESALKSGRPYLISELGLALGNDLRILKDVSGLRLVEFIRDRLTSRFQLVRLGEHANVYALTLANGTSATPTPAALGQVDAAVDNASTFENGEKRYHYRFWAAFSVPLTSEVRHLNRRTLTFNDTSNTVPLPEGALLIRADLIPPGDLENRDKAINRNISTWLTENNLLANEFWASPKTLPRVTTVTNAPAGVSVLEHMLECLDWRQLQNTTLTLDVVRALLRKHV